MKSIYRRIILILLLGFIVQVFLAGIFYQHVVVNNIIKEINDQENSRQEILQDIINSIQKYPNNLRKTQTVINDLTRKYKVSIDVKNMDGTTVLKSNENTNSISNIQEHAYVKVGSKLEYIIYGYFPARINSSATKMQDIQFRMWIAIAIFIISFIASFFIYKTLTDSFKKLSKAASKINYGNTLVEIPYYENDEFGMLCRSFEEMGRRLKTSEKNQQELIAAISHDIKTPLTSIMGYSKRLVESKVTEERKDEYYKIIYRKANDLRLLLEELGDYSNIKDNYRKVKVNCIDYLNVISKEIKSEVEHKGAEFKFISKVNSSINIEIDESKLKRVFMNVIENSLKYANENCSITLNCFDKSDKVYFEIGDNGSGVPSEQLTKIFDKFYRVDTSRSREKGGTGLGLAICKDIVENHGGSIGARNNEDGGLCIWFYLLTNNKI
jgi:signal transduction histidine kinase